MMDHVSTVLFVTADASGIVQSSQHQNGFGVIHT